MLRVLKTALATTMVLALAACNMTAPVVETPADDEIKDRPMITKSEVVESEEESGGASPPVDEPAEEEAPDGGGGGRGNQKK